jgi:CO/xanthine dehydrogenase FAD-binding subunit
MTPFSYQRPTTLQDAFNLLERHGRSARLLAGGTDLIVQLRHRVAVPRVVIDLKHVAELAPAIVWSAGSVRINAGTVMADIIDDERMRRHFPAVTESAAAVGSVQIRHRATLAGNICNASPAADTVPALLVYGAQVAVAGRAGERLVPVADFLLGPRRTACGPNEIVTSVCLPVPLGPYGAAFARLTRRRGVDLATMNLCCGVDTNGTTTFAYGAVGPRAFLVSDDSGALADPNAAAAAKEAVLVSFAERATPISDIRGSAEYRRAMLPVLSRRTLTRACDRLEARRACPTAR